MFKKHLVIRLVTSIVILLCVLSRGVAIPMYLGQLGWLRMDESLYRYFDGASEILLFVSGITGVGVILFYVIKAHRMRSRMRARLRNTAAVEEVNESAMA